MVQGSNLYSEDSFARRRIAKLQTFSIRFREWAPDWSETHTGVPVFGIQRAGTQAASNPHRETTEIPNRGGERNV
jgi:hypothetical protein